MRNRRRLRLKVLIWRSFARGTAAAVALGVIAMIGLAAPAYGTADPSSAVPKSEAPSPRGKDRPAAAFLAAAEALYAAAVSGDPFETRLYLRQTEVRLRSLPMHRIATAEGIEALADSVARMKRAVAAVSIDARKWTDGAAEIRLAADALAHPDKPLWHRYRSVLREDVVSLDRAIKKTGVSPESSANLNRLKAHYRLIRTSVLLHSETFVIERSDSILRYAERLLSNSKSDPDLLVRLTPSLLETMEGMFPAQGRDRAAVAPPLAGPPWGWSAFMGTFIVSVLAWVGWRRYQGVDRITPRETLPQERREPR